MVQPPGFVDAQHPARVCKLRKSMYGLKQEPRAWYQELSSCLVGLRFVNSKMDPSLLIYQQAGVTGYFLVYVDDLILIGNCSQFLSQVIAKLGANFSLKDLGHLNYFIGLRWYQPAKGYSCLNTNIFEISSNGSKWMVRKQCKRLLPPRNLFILMMVPCLQTALPIVVLLVHYNILP